MRFLRHLAVVLLVVAAVVLLALAWNHVEGGTLATGPHGPGARVPVVALRAGRVVARPRSSAWVTRTRRRQTPASF